MLRLHPRSWPIRWRLTALNVGVLAATLLLLGGVLLLQLEGALIGIAGDYLRDQARPILQAQQVVRLSGSPERTRVVVAGSFNVQRAGGILVRRLSGPDTGVMVFDTSGSLVAASEGSDELEPWPEPPPELLEAALAGAEPSLVVNQQTRRALLLLFPLRGPDGAQVGVLQVAGSLQLVDQLQERLRLVLIVGTLLAVLTAGGLGLRATRAALRPLDRVVQAARDIGAGRLDERLRLHRPDEIGALAEAFDQMLDRLAAALAAQRRFVADAAHELRTPLTALGGMVEMLQLGADRGDQATVRRMLDTMDREIGRLGRLVGDLLTLSRLDAHQPLAMKPVELGALVSEAASQTRLLARGQDVELQLADTPTILGDSDRLKQVVLNLTANAVAFTPPEGRIALRLERVNGHARLSVADNGSGIAPEALPRVMDRFVRGDPSRARATGGSGLGLAIAREIVEAHGGRLALESEPGRGTTAIVELPIPSGGVEPARAG